MGAKRLLVLAEKYAKARRKYLDVYELDNTVSGLDEFHPKFVEWENALYKAEQEKDSLKTKLLNECFKTFGN